MTKISPADRSRVEKLANMLASDFDGERANAGRFSPAWQPGNG